MNHFFSIVIATALILPTYARANEIEVARDQLLRQIELCELIADTVLTIDLGRLKILKEASKTTLQSIDSVGIGNMQTMNFYQMQIITYDYSDRFLKMIESGLNGPSLAELTSIAATIKRERGGQFLKITNFIFTNMEKHFRELRQELPPSESLAAILDSSELNLWAELGNVIARSYGGDLPGQANCSAVKLYFKVKGLYPEFDRLAQSNRVYDIALSIIGLSEFYAEYAKPDEALCP